MTAEVLAALRAHDEALQAEQFEAFHALRKALARREERTVSQSRTEEKGER